MTDPEHLSLYEHGAQLFGGAAVSILAPLLDALADHDKVSPGSRISGNRALAAILSDVNGPSAIAARLAGSPVRPVRAVLFDKSPDNNWVLGWHQDRTISVSHRIETPGYGPWTIKHKLLHVQPPFAVIERMVTLRIHIDRVDAPNAPLLIALGSHRRGKIAEKDILGVVLECEQFTCLAEAGDVWAYSTPIVHASGRSKSLTRRRVLQVDYSAELLPNSLAWLGI